MDNKEKIEEILNKQFKKSIFSGYETLDVDTYFDEVIEYLKLNDKRVKEAEKIAAELKAENEKLSKKVEQLSIEAAKMSTLIKEYQQNGYDNVVQNARVQDSRKNNEGK